jgi:hypothetical protein
LAERKPAKDHGQVAAELEREAEQASGDKAKFLREAARLVRNPKLQQAVQELGNDPAARDKAKKNPKEFIKGKGVNLPADFEVEVTG